jgi:hypothetical protein
VQVDAVVPLLQLMVQSKSRFDVERRERMLDILEVIALKPLVASDLQAAPASQRCFPVDSVGYKE